MIRSSGRTFTHARPGPRVPVIRPEIDIVQQGNELHIRVDMPGADKSDIRVDVHAGVIFIQARAPGPDMQGKKLLHLEFVGCEYRLKLILPDAGIAGIAEKIQSTFAHGVLTLKLPAGSMCESRSIEIFTE